MSFNVLYSNRRCFMTDKERQDLIKEIQKTARKVSKSASEGKKLLIRAGICTPTGRLRKEYK